MIPFRKQRLATSVVNRILNVADGIAPRGAEGAPAAPEPLASGAELEAQMAAPKPPVSADPETTEAVALAPLVD